MRARAAALLSALTVVVCALVAGACSGTGGEGPAQSTTGGTSSAGEAILLDGVAGDVVIPAYEALVRDLGALDTAVDVLCEIPVARSLDDARAAWRDASTSWQRSRPGALGPATERRLMSAVGFTARPSTIEELLSGADPIDPASLDGEGATVRGIYAAEVGLFGEGADALVTPDGARRCAYVASVTSLAMVASDEVLTEWTASFRTTFAAGIDGERQASIGELVNEVTQRTRELDEKGLRDFAAAGSVEDIAESRLDGPAAFAMADRRALLDGVVDLVGGGGTGIVALVAARSPETAERLEAAAVTAAEAMAALPDSVAGSFEVPDDVAAAADAVAALKVVLATEVASQLGVTINFSDADGDS